MARATTSALTLSAAAILGFAAVNVVRRRAARHLLRPTESGTARMTSVTVNRSPEELYRFWRSMENLPRFMRQLNRVEGLDGRLFLWSVGAAEEPTEWKVDVTGDVPDQCIAWQATGVGPLVQGVVSFEPMTQGRGTRVTLTMDYAPDSQVRNPAGALLLRERAQDLRRFKQLMETGEIPTTEGQPTGRRSMLSRALPQ